MRDTLHLRSTSTSARESTAQARALLASVRPRDAAGKTRRGVAAELIADLERVYQRKKAADKELEALLAQTGTSLLTLPGIGPSGAARLLVDVGDITRFPSRAHFASWNGTTPIDASSGAQIRHRLSRAGNRQMSSDRPARWSLVVGRLKTLRRTARALGSGCGFGVSILCYVVGVARGRVVHV